MSYKHLILPVAAVALLGARADAGFWTFSNVVNGAQEVPPTGSPATGFAGGDYNDVTNVLNITVFADGFTTSVTDAHIHGPAAPGANAGILFGLGVGSGAGYQYFRSNTFTLSETQEGQFLAGLYYVNIHTQQHLTGEIRGQLNPVPEPATMVALGLGAFAVAWRRRRKTV